MRSTTLIQADLRGEPAEKNSADLLARGARPAVSEPRRLLFLDDDPVRAEAFLIENPSAVWVQTVEECVGRLVENWDEVHLDHDLGGKTFVDVNATDCGMEVIRWLCAPPRDHLRSTLFFIHTHNSLAGLLMVLQMRSNGYKAEFRPFGVDPARLLADDDDGFPDGDQSQAHPQRPQTLRRLFERFVGVLKGGWRPSTRRDA